MGKNQAPETKCDPNSMRLSRFRPEPDLKSLVQYIWLIFFLHVFRKFNKAIHQLTRFNFEWSVEFACVCLNFNDIFSFYQKD